MNDELKKNFVRFIIENNILTFGKFKTKAGRISPYFFNTGSFNTGYLLNEVSKYYAITILKSQIPFDMLFGPAYKGIPLVSAIAINLLKKKIHTSFAFNRKEEKDHGEGGQIIGAKLRGKILVIDDVISSGLSIAQSIDIIKEQNASPTGVITSLDRMEKGIDGTSATHDIKLKYNIISLSIINIKDVLNYLTRSKNNSFYVSAINKYLDRYGI